MRPRRALGFLEPHSLGRSYRSDSTLPSRMRYFDGHPPAELTFGTAWPTAHFVWVDSVTEVPRRIHHSYRLPEAGHVGAAGALPSASNAERARPARRMLPPGD